MTGPRAAVLRDKPLVTPPTLRLHSAHGGAVIPFRNGSAMLGRSAPSGLVALSLALPPGAQNGRFEDVLTLEYLVR